MSDDHQFDYKFKIMLLGETQIGKTCLITRYSKNSFSLNYITTVGIDYQIKYIPLRDKLIKLQIWDTAGQERFRNITKNYFQGSNGFLLAYDITSMKTFQSVHNWLKQIKENAPEEAKIILIGTKCDLETKREVPYEEGKKLADEKGFKFFETSAKDDTNIKEAFEELGLEILDNEEKNGSSARNSIEIKSKLHGGENKKKRCC